MSQPMPTPTFSAPSGGLRLGIAAHERTVDLLLENVGSSPLDVLSHVAANGKQLDWFELHLTDADGASRALHLADARRESTPVKVQLAPGQRLAHVVDLDAWATRPGGGGRALAPGAWSIRAAYEVHGEPGVWQGRLEAGPVAVTIP